MDTPIEELKILHGSGFHSERSSYVLLLWLLLFILLQLFATILILSLAAIAICLIEHGGQCFATIWGQIMRFMDFYQLIETQQ